MVKWVFKVFIFEIFYEVSCESVDDEDMVVSDFWIREEIIDVYSLVVLDMNMVVN